jgi:hypothetical protein
MSQRLSLGGQFRDWDLLKVEMQFSHTKASELAVRFARLALCPLRALTQVDATGMRAVPAAIHYYTTPSTSWTAGSRSHAA